MLGRYSLGRWPLAFVPFALIVVPPIEIPPAVISGGGYSSMMYVPAVEDTSRQEIQRQNEQALVIVLQAFLSTRHRDEG